MDYVAAVAQRVLDETGCYPINAGTLTRNELVRPVAASMGSCSSGAQRLTERGGHGSPDKKPFRRWLTLARAGALRVPMTTCGLDRDA